GYPEWPVREAAVTFEPVRKIAALKMRAAFILAPAYDESVSRALRVRSFLGAPAGPGPEEPCLHPLLYRLAPNPADRELRRPHESADEENRCSHRGQGDCPLDAVPALL